jgi:hypothetical protein
VPKATVNVSVIQFLDSDLSPKKSAKFVGTGLVGLPGSTQEVPIGGDAGAEFSATVQLGEAWYYVSPVSNPDFLKTYSLLQLAVDQTSIELPILDRPLLSSIYLQAGTSPLDATAGHIVVRFVDALYVPMAGVRITGAPMKGLACARLYDSGPGGSYVADTTGADGGGTAQTSTLGTVIITNVTDGIGALSYTVNGVARQTPQIDWVKQLATFAVVVVPN